MMVGMMGDGRCLGDEYSLLELQHRTTGSYGTLLNIEPPVVYEARRCVRERQQQD